MTHKTIFLPFVVSLCLWSGGASAMSGDCGFVPDLNHADKTQVASYLLTASGSEGTDTEERVCAYYGLGTLYHFDGDYEKALFYYGKAIALWRAYANAYEAQGDAYAALGKLDLSAESYRMAEASPIDHREALADRCRTRAIRGAPLDRALTDCSALLSRYDDDYDTMQWRSLVLYRMRRFDDAIAQCDTLLQSYPRNAGGLYIRGLAELAKGNAAAGQADLTAATDSDHRIAPFFALYGIKAP